MYRSGMPSRCLGEFVVHVKGAFPHPYWMGRLGLEGKEQELKSTTGVEANPQYSAQGSSRVRTINVKKHPRPRLRAEKQGV